MTKILIASILICMAACKQLMMIQQTFRHGARNPVFPQSADQSIFAKDTNTLGQLTKQGKSMHYLLGKIIYEKYWQQLFTSSESEWYNETDFYVKSTDVNRTLESAQCHLFGLLQKAPKLQLSRANYEYALPAWSNYKKQQNISDLWSIFQNSETFHPTPIHSQKRGASYCDDGDFLTKYDVEDCPNQAYWKAQNFNSDANLEVMRNQQIKQAVKALSDEVGFEVEWEDVYKWKDSYTCMKYLGKPTLKVFENPKYSNILNFIQVYSMYLFMYSQPQQIQTVATLYFNHTLNNFQGKVRKQFIPKIVIYSSHDTTIGMIFAAMNFVNTKCLVDHYLNGVDNNDTCKWQYPPFTANIIFELWNNNGEFTVRMLYNGEIQKIPICNYKSQCTLAQFRDWFDGFKVKSVSKSCGYVGQNKTYYAIIFLLSSAIICLAFYICYLHAKIRQIDTVGRAKREGYIQNFQQKQQQMIQNKQ